LADGGSELAVAVVELFAESGQIPAMGHIAARAGIGKATLYRSYRTIDALLHAAAYDQLHELRAISQDRLDAAGDPLQTLVDMIYAVFDYNRERGLYLEVVRRGNLDPDVAEAMAGTNAPLRAAMQACQDRGLLRDDVDYADLQMLAGGCAANLSLIRAGNQQWNRAAYLVLTSLGVPRERAERP
jgi:AcrR family transcriptional regulator